MAKKNITPKEEELEISSPSVSDNSTPSDSPTPKAEESKEPTAEKAVGGFYGATVNPQLDNPDEWYDGEIQPAVLSVERKKDTPSPKVENLNDPDPNIGPSDLSPVEVETKITDPNLGSLNVTAQTNTQPVETKEDSLSTLRKAYDPQIEALGTTIGEMQKAYDKAKEQDKVTQRRERNMQMIAGISDGLSALANLIGTGSYGSSHINLKEAFANPVLQKKFEEAQKERKKDIKDINERLSQKEKELLAMKLAYGKDVSSLLADKERAAEDRAFRTSERLATQEYQDDVREDTQEHQTKLQEGAQAHETSEREARQKFTATENKKDRESRGAIAKNSALADITKTQIRYGTGAGKDKTTFVFDDPVSGNMRSINLSDKSLTNILAAYLPEAIKRGEITADEAEDAKNWKSNEVSKTNLLGMVNKSTVMRQALLAAVGEEVEEKPVNKPVADFRSSAYDSAAEDEEETGSDPSWAQAYTATGKK